MTVIDELVLPRRGWRTDRKNGSIQFIGNATTIIRYAGFTILTDPNFLHQGDHVHLGYGLKSERLTNPAIDIDDLPKVDLVVLSHLHEDHFDRVAMERLDRGLPIVTTDHAAQELANAGFTATHGLDTWESFTVRRGDIVLTVTAMPGRHGGPIVSKALPPVMGSMLEFTTAAGNRLMRLYISGDTLPYRDLKEIPVRYPDIDIAMLHLGGTRILGIMLTMDGKQGAKTAKLLGPQIVIPVHYNDYTVFSSPIEDFLEAMKAEGLEDRVRYLQHGETYRWRVPSSRL